MQRGKLICVEGGEGAGKSTLIKAIAAWLPSHIGHRIISTREPGGTELGCKIREILLWTEVEIQPIAELFLYASDRIQHTERIIKPALAAGDFVVCDRGEASTFAYQGYGRGTDLEIISRVGSLTGAIAPDLTLWLDVEPEIGLARSGKTDRFEAQEIEFHRRVREGYQAYANTHKNVTRIDANLSQDEVFEQARWILSSQLFLWGNERYERT